VNLKLQARLEDLNVWQMKKTKEGKRELRSTFTGWLPGEKAAKREMSI
jgi:hypothetical protein